MKELAENIKTYISEISDFYVTYTYYQNLGLLQLYICYNNYKIATINIINNELSLFKYQDTKILNVPLIDYRLLSLIIIENV